MNNSPSEDTVRVATSHGPMWVFRGDVYVSRSLATYGEYVAAESDLFAQIVRAGMTVVEVGANIGSHSVFLARACAPGIFYGFEPQQRVFQLLAANMVINGVSNARIYPQALGNHDGRAELEQPQYSSAGNFGAVSLDRKVREPEKLLNVGVSTLDSWALAACHFLKIDVEGWECQVVEGARETIQRCRPIIYTENDRAASQGTLIDLIAGLNYRLFWHVAPLFRANNFRGVAENVFGNTASLNMLCIPTERKFPVTGLNEINPANWTSPFAGL